MLKSIEIWGALFSEGVSAETVTTPLYSYMYVRVLRTCRYVVPTVQCTFNCGLVIIPFALSHRQLGQCLYTIGHKYIGVNFTTILSLTIWLVILHSIVTALTIYLRPGVYNVQLYKPFQG